MYRKILVPLDGSVLAECSLAHVKEVVKGSQTTAVVLIAVISSYHDYEEMGKETKNIMERSALDKARDYLSKIASDLHKDGINASTFVTKGPPAEKILDYAKNSGVDLVILSTHGSSGISRWLTGGVAERIIHNSTVPVLVVAPQGSRT